MNAANPTYDELRARCERLESELDELRPMREKYAALYENAPLPYQSLDAEGRILEINPAWLRTLGYERNEILGRWFGDFLHPEYVPHFRKNFPAFKKRGYVNDVRFRMKHKSGADVQVSFQGCIGYTPEGEFRQAYCVFRDMTEERQAQRALRESEHRFRSFVENASDVVYSLTPDGTISYASPNWKAYLGEPPEKAIGRKPDEYVHPDDVQTCREFIARVRAGRKAYGGVEYRVRSDDGQWLWHLSTVAPIREENGTVTGYVGMARDVTKEHRMREALTEANLRRDTVVRAANVGLWDWDLRTDEVSYSAEWKRQIGYKEHEIGNGFMEWEKRVHPDDLEPTISRVRQAIENREEAYQIEFRFRHKDGSYRWILAQGSVLCDESATPIRALGSHVDITKHKQAQEHIVSMSEMVDAAPASITVHDAEGRFLYANAATLALHGYESKEVFMAINLHDLDVPESAALMPERVRAIEEHGEARFEVQHFRKDGSTFPLEILAKKTEWSGRPAILSIGTDISERKRAEEELRRRESLLQRIFDILPVGLWIADRNGKLLRGNPEGVRIWGAEPHVAPEEYGVFSARLLPSGREVGPEDWALMRSIREGAIVTNEMLEIDAFDGETRTVLNFTAPVNDEHGNIEGAIVLNEDITERRKAERAVRESETRFRTLLESLDNIPVQGYDADRRVIYWNDASEEVYGYSRKEAMGRKLEDLIVPDAMREATISAVDEWIAGGAPIPAEELILRDKDQNDVEVYSSHVMHITESGEREMFCVDVDLRSLRRAEKQLQRLATAIEQVGEIVVVTDTDGTIQYVNPAFERVTGYSPKEATGKNPSILQSGHQDEAFYRELWSTVTGGKTWEGRMVNKRKDDRLYTEEATISPVIDNQGRIVNYVAVKRDITEQLKLEDQYRQAQKMEAIGQLTGGVAHDFNNLLQVINGNADLALVDVAPDHPAQESLVEILKAGQRAAGLVEQLLAFSRKQIMRSEVLDLDSAIANLLKMLGRVIGEHVRVEWVPGLGHETIFADRGMIEQALVNLCVNARDAMPGGGVLTIETANATLDEDFCERNGGTEPGKYAALSVTDTGVGINREHLENIFEPFFTTKEVGKGTGLGLATVYGIVRQHNGMINASSQPGTGATFRIYLPLCGKDAIQPQTPQAPHTRGGSETILIAEDEKAVRELAARVLRRNGYRVLEATDGKQALALFEKHADDIDLALLDIVMPKCGGREAHKRMIATRPDLKTVFASGYSEDAIATDFVLDPGLILIQKPYTRQSLLLTVRQALDG